MKLLDENNPYEKALIRLINSIDGQVPLPEEDKVLILLRLDSEEKIKKFNKWVGGRLQGETLNATATEITRAAVKISKGLPVD